MNKPLCRCNNCYSILIDENPQVNAPSYQLNGGELEMVQVKDENGDLIWGCPNCGTDEYLVDLQDVVCDLPNEYKTIN